MRTRSRSAILLLVGVLSGAGCESQGSWTLPALTGGPDLTTAVVMGRPTPLGPAEPGDEERSEHGDEGARPVLWRASAHVLDGELADPVPAFHLPRHFAAPVPEESPPGPVQNDLPRELSKVAMPPYRVEPPDVLVINARHLVSRPPYRIEPLDELTIQAPPTQVLPNEAITGGYTVGPDGRVNLGYSYGKVAVAGLTTEEAASAIRKHVADSLSIKPPSVSVVSRRAREPEPVRGEHPVRMDGTISLGGYGDLFVAGLTLAELKLAVEAQLAAALVNPEVTVDVAATNSKAYYVVCDAGGYQQVIRRPLLGGETVLDALSESRGLPPPALAQVWIARPVPGQVGYRQLLPVDWAAITAGGATNTNYQLFPGDRVYVRAAPATMTMTWGSGVSKVMAWFGH
jgi:polysaccharide export outer membrane protein